MAELRGFRRARGGEAWQSRPVPARGGTVRDAIAKLRERRLLPGAGPADDPVFIMGTGWRTGSTLLQRLVMSSGDVMVWGEPFAMSAPVQVLTDSMGVFATGHPPDRFFLSRREEQDRGDLSDAWIANLYPDSQDLVEAHRAYLSHLLAEPARRMGFGRWGLKEVRLRPDDAAYLRVLFPRARISVIYRNPYDAYRSYLGFRQVWYDRWPDRPVATASAFGHMWRTRVEGFLEHAEDLDLHLVRYEELTSGEHSLDALGAYVGCAISTDILHNRVRGAHGREPPPLSASERRRLAAAVDPVADRLGYTSPSRPSRENR